MVAVAITRTELDAAGLRTAAGRSRDASAARRMLALAAVLEGSGRAAAARSAAMDRQTLRDWVHRYNEHGLAGLSDKIGQVGPKPRLSPTQQAELAQIVRQGPDLAEHGVVRWRAADERSARRMGHRCRCSAARSGHSWIRRRSRRSIRRSTRLADNQMAGDWLGEERTTEIIHAYFEALKKHKDLIKP